MAFNSLGFLLFACVVFPAYWAMRAWPARRRWLLLASWAFYASWSPAFLALLIATTWVDFQLAKEIHRVVGTGTAAGRRRGRVVVAASLVMNLGVLVVFKYGRFLWAQLAAVLPLPPVPAALPAAPPLGISFYTFHEISYMVDTFRGLRPPTWVFGEFALYVAFFPQLIAGPITRWSFFGPQVQTPRTVDDDGVERGFLLVATGLVKKVVLADTLGVLVDRVWADPGAAARPEIVLALYAYAFQIYFDFSGYTDVAHGLARLLGFRLPENFRHPYRAASPREFWQRWHISLSTWLRDYLYVPLGGNRRGRGRTYVNLLVTMVLGGLWHGAAWTFVLWGAFHGLWLAGHRLVRELADAPPRTPLALRRLATFHAVVAGWVLFRAPSLAAIGALAAALRGARPMSGPFPVAAAAAILVGVATHALAGRVELEDWWRRTPRFAQGIALGVVMVVVGLCSARSQRFIYFQF